MEPFLDYLTTTKTSLNNGSFKSIHVVLGNESCDLDSCISSISLAYFLHTHRSLCGINLEDLVVAVQNVSYEHFALRSDNCYVLQKAAVPLDSLIYKDQVDLPNILAKKQLTCTLVDHHVLSETDQILTATVKRIIDHRPVDPSANWKQDNIKIRIEQVGSCSTLIADEIFKADHEFLFKELASMIYQTIVYDTIALLPENGKAKELDLSIAAKLKKDFDFTQDTKILYKELWQAHNDVTNLTPYQLLHKDLKIVDGVPLPGLPMLTKDFLIMKDAYNAVQKFSNDYDASIVVLIGLDARNEVKRDVALFHKDDKLKDRMLEKLKNCSDFEFSEVQMDLCNVTCLRQGNVKLSRKQIVPLIKEALKS